MRFDTSCRRRELKAKLQKQQILQHEDIKPFPGMAVLLHAASSPCGSLTEPVVCAESGRCLTALDSVTNGTNRRKLMLDSRQNYNGQFRNIPRQPCCSQS